MKGIISLNQLSPCGLVLSGVCYRHYCFGKATKAFHAWEQTKGKLSVGILMALGRFSALGKPAESPAHAQNPRYWRCRPIRPFCLASQATGRSPLCCALRIVLTDNRQTPNTGRCQSSPAHVDRAPFHPVMPTLAHNCLAAMVTWYVELFGVLCGACGNANVGDNVTTLYSPLVPVLYTTGIVAFQPRGTSANTFGALLGAILVDRGGLIILH